MKRQQETLGARCRSGQSTTLLQTGPPLAAQALTGSLSEIENVVPYLLPSESVF